MFCFQNSIKVYFLAHIVTAQTQLSVLIKTKGIVFRKIKYAESSLIADIFTESHGLMSYIIGGVRSARARTKASVLELMTIVDMVAYHSDKKKLHRIKEIRPAYTYQSIPFDVRKNAMLLFMAELCARTIRETEENRTLFACIAQHLQSLDQATANFSNRHLEFMIDLADHLGFGPSVNFSSNQPGFDMLDGRFVSSPPAHPYYVAEAKDLFDLVRKVRLQEGTLELDRSRRNKLIDDLLLYFKLHIDSMRELHSHKILRDVL